MPSPIDDGDRKQKVEFEFCLLRKNLHEQVDNHGMLFKSPIMIIAFALRRRPRDNSESERRRLQLRRTGSPSLLGSRSRGTLSYPVRT